MPRKKKKRRNSNRGRPPFLPRSFREWIWPALIFSTLFFGLIAAEYFLCRFYFSTDVRSPMSIIYINFILFANNIVTIAGYKKLRRQRRIAPKKLVFTLVLVYQWGLQAAGIYIAILFF